MNTSNQLRNFDLENDVVGILLDCPWMAIDVQPCWFVNQLQAATVSYLREHNQRDGITQHLADLFGMDRGDVYETLQGWRRGGWQYSQATFLPRYCRRLQELFTRREKLALGTRLARAAFAGVAVVG